MSIPTSIAQAAIDTVLVRLTVLFLVGAAGNPIAARQAASQMLAAHKVETDEELRLAAEIISFSLHALEALSQASATDFPTNKILRFRGSAVSHSREAHKAQRKLDLLQRARQTGALQPVEVQPTPPAPDRPQIDQPLELIQPRPEAPRTVSNNPTKTWSQLFQKRETAKRITENLKKSQAQHANRPEHLNPTSATAQSTVPPD
jgi:hypothetical protein